MLGTCGCGPKLDMRGKPQGSVHVSTYRGNPFWNSGFFEPQLFEPQPCVSPPNWHSCSRFHAPGFRGLIERRSTWIFAGFSWVDLSQIPVNYNEKWAILRDSLVTHRFLDPLGLFLISFLCSWARLKGERSPAPHPKSTNKNHRRTRTICRRTGPLVPAACAST